MNEEDVVDVVPIHTGMLFSHKKEILPLEATWINLEDITLSEISLRKTNAMEYHFYEE